MDLSQRILFGFTLVAVAGFAVFGLRPQLLQYVPSLGPVYAAAFPFFGQAHVWLCAAVLFLFLVRHVRGAWLLSFVVVYAASLFSELAGTTRGVPFGAYAYSSLLGPKWLGHVPVIIPLSWFIMVVPSYALARHAFPGRSLRWTRVLFAAVLLAAWDLSLDPAMSYLTGYWAWKQPGPFYGMPLMNLFGWMLTGAVLMVLMEATGADRWVRWLSVRWMGVYYGIVLLMPFGMVVAGGLWGAAAATVVVLAAAVWVISRRTGRRSASGEAGVRSMGAPVREMAEMSDLKDYFRHHSRTFSFASRWFPPDQYHLVASVYAFCRTTDDLVDRAEGLPPEEIARRLEAWRVLVHRAYQGEAEGPGWLVDLMFVSAQARVPLCLIDELIDGVGSDIRPAAMPTYQALERYTYRVASVVGLWLCHLFGVRDEATLRQAAALGRAMQITNILRDVGEDWRQGRIYLPEDLMRQHGVCVDDLAAMASGSKPTPSYIALLEDLMARAEAAYAVAFEGVPALPHAFGRSVAVAASAYRGIHAAIRRNGYDNFHRRAYTRPLDKAVLAARGLFELARLRRRNRRSTARRMIPDALRPAGPPLRRALPQGPLAGRRYGMGVLAVMVGFSLYPAIPGGIHPQHDETPVAASVFVPDVPADDDLVEQMRAFYLRGVERRASIDSALALPASGNPDPVVEAYRAALVVLKAKHAFWPTTKLAHLERGLPVLDRLVQEHPRHAEIRYLRLLSCYFLPGFLGRKDSVREDVAALSGLLPPAEGDFPPDLYREMLLFVLDAGEIEPAARARLSELVDQLPERG